MRPTEIELNQPRLTARHREYVMFDAENTPVIVGIGEACDRPDDVADALEPIALMAEALQSADRDGGGGWLAQADTIDLIGLVSWRYEDPVATLCNRLGISPAERRNASMGGETPIRLIHEAALRIAAGQQTAALIVGGESLHSRTRAKKERALLPWTPPAAHGSAVVFPSSSFETSKIAKQLGVKDPASIYPFYEMAAQASWSQSPDEAHRDSAKLWSRYAAVAAGNEYAWLRNGLDAEAIGTVGPDNRMINWPYPKLMTANPNVNQAAAIIVTSLAFARKQGVAEDRIVYIWGGAAAIEPEDFLRRDTYDQSSAQTATLDAARQLVGGDAERFDFLELYSCFPVVPKMAMRALGLKVSSVPPTVAGGLTFFGGPLNNYMSHAVAAMVRKLRVDRDKTGLLYGQGGFVNKHHAMVLGGKPAAHPLATDYSVQDRADALRGPVPELIEDYSGRATIETYTIEYGRDGTPTQGIVIARTPEGRRTMGRIRPDNEAALALLASRESNAIGVDGWIAKDAFGKPSWDIGKSRARPRKFCKVEREGHLTIITIDRPETMNALHPACNAELAEAFDEFAADSDQWVAIITGAGERAFSAGNDLKYFSAALARGEKIETPLSGFGGLTERFDLSKPVIAAVNGIAMGGGFEIALASDIVIASDSATFALPEPKVGLAALAGGLLRLPRQIGLKPAMGMILSGRQVTAEEGKRLGFVNEVVPSHELMAEARQWAAQIIGNSPMAVRASKQIVMRGLGEQSIEAGSAAQKLYPATRALFRSSDVREGSLAFAQKRAPLWKSE